MSNICKILKKYSEMHILRKLNSTRSIFSNWTFPMTNL